MSYSLITLTTDFGLTDGFVGVMRGVILGIAPHAQIIDLSHGIAPQQIQQGAFLLANSVPFFPRAAIHVCVVDPGVGSARRAIAILVGETIFVGPDNGVLSLAVSQMQSATGDTPRAFELTNPRYFLPRISNTFHGRDIFSPSAAHLANGVAPAELGAPLAGYITLAPPAPSRQADGALIGHIIYIDQYGNIVTDITDTDLASFDPAALTAQVIPTNNGSAAPPPPIPRGLKRTYSDAARGDLLLLIGSPWKLEIALRDGNAAQALNVKVGDQVLVQ